MLEDITSVALHVAASGLAARQRVIADNISNIQTPRFLAGRASFENSLRSAVADGDPTRTRVSIARSLEPTREDGNNVNLDHETLSHIDTNLRYQTVLRGLDDKYGLIRYAMRMA